MAQKNRNQRTADTRSRKASSGRTAKQGRKQEEYYEEEIPAFLQAEVMIILSFAAAVLLFLSNFHLCGVVGDVLRRLQLGLFGVVGYIIPFLVFIGTSFYTANRGNWKAVVKLAAVIGMSLIVCGISHMVFGIKLAEGESVFAFYKLCGESGKGGGLIGGLLAFCLQSIVGTIGTYLIFLAALIICGVCITEKSFVNVVKSSSDRAYQYAKEDVARRREEREERQEERRRLREEKVVRGVDFGSIRIQEPMPIEEPQAAGSQASRLSEKAATPNFAESRMEPAGQAQSPADVFSGRIELPPEYAEPVPFEEDIPAPSGITKPYAPEKGRNVSTSADRPVAVKEEKPEDKIMSFSRKAPKKKEGPLYADREIMTLEEMDAGLNLPELPGKSDQNGAMEQDWDAFTDEIFIEEIGAQKGNGIQAVKRNYEDTVRSEPMYQENSQTVYAADNHKGSSTTFEPENTMPSDVGRKENFIRKEDFGQEFYFDEDESFYKGTEFGEEPGLDSGFELTKKAESRMEEKPQKQVETYEETGFHHREEPLRETRLYQEAAESGVNYDSIFVPEEPKRVVTASGKVIETETELLHKKIEQKREEAAEGNSREAVNAAVTKQEPVKKPYVFPPTSLLKTGTKPSGSFSEQEYKDTAIKLQQTLRNFGVGVTVTNISCGPTVTRYELHPEQGVKVSKIVGLADDIKLSLAAAEIRIEAPIPGKSAVGIEVPNKENSIVYLRELLESEGFVNSKSKLTFAVGKDIGGLPVTADIGKMPHLLIAGATGSGKSVCINTLIMSIIYKADPEDVKLIMVDPKVVELSVYNGIPHLMIPVVTDPKKASGALNWAVAEMGDRYKKFAEYNVRDLKGYNEKIKNIQDIPEEKRPQKLPQIVIIVDELADLMMVVPGEVEDAICRLAQLARAAGIHLVIATQRPSVNVITGLIKANVPSRIAFSVSSGVDSRTIIDMNGAEKLLGKGDMLFYPSGVPKPQRVQGAFVSDSEVSSVVEFLTQQGLTASYSTEVESKMMSSASDLAGGGDSSRDEYFVQAGKFIIEKEKASIGMLQRVFKIGFNRAARIMDQLADAGVVGEEEGTKPRKILMTMEEFENMVK